MYIWYPILFTLKTVQPYLLLMQYLLDYFITSHSTQVVKYIKDTGLSDSFLRVELPGIISDLNTFTNGVAYCHRYTAEIDDISRIMIAIFHVVNKPLLDLENCLWVALMTESMQMVISECITGALFSSCWEAVTAPDFALIFCNIHPDHTQCMPTIDIGPLCVWRTHIMTVIAYVLEMIHRPAMRIAFYWVSVSLY